MTAVDGRRIAATKRFRANKENRSDSITIVEIGKEAKRNKNPDAHRERRGQGGCYETRPR